jgi:hypothetical protein
MRAKDHGVAGGQHTEVLLIMVSVGLVVGVIEPMTP